MPRKPPLGNDPLGDVDAAALDDLLPPRRRQAQARPAAAQDPTPSSPGEAPPPKPPRRRRRTAPSPRSRTAGSATGTGRLTVDLPAAALDAAKTAVYWTPGLTLTALTDHALQREVARLEAERGEPFPAAGGDLTPGPPVRPR